MDSVIYTDSYIPNTSPRFSSLPASARSRSRFMSYSNLYVMYAINSYQLQVAVSNKSGILTPNLLPTHLINPCIYKSVVDIGTERLPLKGQVCEASSIDNIMHGKVYGANTTGES